MPESPKNNRIVVILLLRDLYLCRTTVCKNQTLAMNDGHDCHRRTGDTDKNNRRTTVGLW